MTPGGLGRAASALLARLGRSPHARLVALFVAASTAADLFFFTGFIASDDIIYTTGAQRILETGRLWSDPQPTEMRLFMLGWCTLVAGLFGPDVQVVAASFVLFHQVLNVLTFFLGRAAEGDAAGRLACFWMAIFPAAVSFSTTILPDISMACFLCLAFLLVQHAHGRRRDGQASLAALFAAGSGVSVGIAYLHKESGLVPLPFLMALCLLGGGRWRWASFRVGVGCAAAMAAGILSMLIVEGLVLRLLTGAWTFRLRWILAGGGALPDAEAIVARVQAFKYALAAQIVPGAVVVPLGVVLLVAWVVHRRARPIVLFTAWFIGYYIGGSVSLGGYSPPSLQARYFIPCLPFVAAALAAVLMRCHGVAAGDRNGAWPSARRLTAGAALAAFAVAPLLWWDSVDRSAGRLYAAPMFRNAGRAIEAWTRCTPAPLVLSDALSRHLFPSFTRGRPPGLRLSHEVDGASLPELGTGGSFYFLDVDRRTAFVDPSVNPLLTWEHGIPPSEGTVDAVVQRSGEGASAAWAIERVAVFRSFAQRTTEARFVATGRERPHDRLAEDDQSVTLFRLSPRHGAR